MMRRYEKAIRSNMASAENDLKTEEDKRGFVIGAVVKLWEVYHRDKQIDESQFDRLIGILKGFPSLLGPLPSMARSANTTAGKYPIPRRTYRLPTDHSSRYMTALFQRVYAKNKQYRIKSITAEQSIQVLEGVLRANIS